MSSYCVDKQPNNNGVHLVHIYSYDIANPGVGCPRKPPVWRRRALGEHASGRTAVANARIIWREWMIEGCPVCCPETRPRRTSANLQ